MELRLTPLNPGHQYVLDAAAECGEMSTACTMALCLYGDDTRIGALVARRAPGSGHRSRRAMTEALSSYGYALLAVMPAARREAFLAMGIAGAAHWCREVVSYAASTAFEDMTTGGATLPFRRIARCDAHYRPTKGVARKLHAPGWIARSVRLNVEIRFGRAIVRRLIAECGGRKPKPDPAFIRAEFERQHRAFRAYWAARPVPPDYIGAPGYDAPTMAAYGTGADGYAPAAAPPAAEARTRAWRILRKRRRRVVVRAAVMAASLLGASTVGAFARGERVVLPGREISLAVSAAGPLAGLGHGGLAVAVQDRNGAHLADLCVYVSETPALDQLTAMALHMEAGLERTIIETANVIRYAPDGAAHPLFAGRRDARIAREAARADGNSASASRQGALEASVNDDETGLAATAWGARRRAIADYEDATRAIWLRAICAFVLGRAGLKLLSGEEERT